MIKEQMKKYLIIYAACIPPVMIVIFTIMSNIFEKKLGYFLPYGIYLTILAVGIIIFSKGTEKMREKECKYRYMYYCLSFFPALATFCVAFLPTVSHMNLKLFLILLVYACVNGSLEELFWRGTFVRVYGDDFRKSYVIPTIIFSCWHFALLFAKGVTYNGGGVALVGGACVMGAIWGFVMYKTRKIEIVIGAHVLVNFFAFSQLIYENWFR